MGIFITFEGPDGCGKTSVIKLVADKLRNEGFDVVCTREPGGGNVSEQIRKVILDVNNKDMDYTTEALLYAASRSQHLHDVVIPSLKDNKIVICDRFVDSSYVYQGFARNIGLDLVMNLNNLVVGEYMPNITILIDLESEKCMDRINRNNRAKDRLDLESLDFHKKVRNGYLSLAEMFKDRIRIVNGDQTLENVYTDTYKIIESYIRGN